MEVKSIMSIIYTNENNPAALKLVIAANFSKKSIEIKVITPQGLLFKFYCRKYIIFVCISDKYLSKCNHLPYLEISENEGLFVPNAAARYLLPPFSDLESIDEWLEWEAVVLSPTVVTFGSSIKNEKQKNIVNSCLLRLDTVLQGKTGLCGVRIEFAMSIRK